MNMRASELDIERTFLYHGSSLGGHSMARTRSASSRNCRCRVSSKWEARPLVLYSTHTSVDGGNGHPGGRTSLGIGCRNPPAGSDTLHAEEITNKTRGSVTQLYLFRLLENGTQWMDMWTHHRCNSARDAQASRNTSRNCLFPVNATIAGAAEGRGVAPSFWTGNPRSMSSRTSSSTVARASARVPSFDRRSSSTRSTWCRSVVKKALRAR